MSMMAVVEVAAVVAATTRPLFHFVIEIKRTAALVPVPMPMPVPVPVPMPMPDAGADGGGNGYLYRMVEAGWR